MSNRSIHILQMGKHFLYLPVYFAAHHKFFDLLPKGVSVVIDLPNSKHTDDATYDEMMNASEDYRDFQMAITDPIQIFRTPLALARKPAILATLVTNGGFWAVNHGSRPVKSLRDLGGFDRIVAFDKGTTSYRIATRIARESGITKPLATFIHVVSPGNELSRMNKNRMQGNTVALSPDILRIEHMEGRKAVSVELELAKTAEYSNEFVDANPDICQGIVSGIHKALLMTQRLDSTVTAFAKDYFHYSERAEGALKKAVDVGVIPTSVAIAEGHWKNAAKAYFASGVSDITWSKAEERKADEYYDACVRPYEKFSREAILHVIADPVSPPEPDTIWKKMAPFVAMLIAIGITALFGWVPALVITLMMFSTYAAAEWVKRTKRSFFKYVLAACAFVGLFLIGLPFIPALPFHDKLDLLLSLGFGFFLPSAIEFAKYADENRK